MNNAFEALQHWYFSQCDEDWEHQYGVKIETLDNPGWLVTIDLENTDLHGAAAPLLFVERTQTDWWQFEVTDNKFIGCGGALNLGEVIEKFLEFWRSNVNDHPH